MSKSQKFIHSFKYFSRAYSVPGDQWTHLNNLPSRLYWRRQKRDSKWMEADKHKRIGEKPPGQKPGMCVLEWLGSRSWTRRDSAAVADWMCPGTGLPWLLSPSAKKCDFSKWQMARSHKTKGPTSFPRSFGLALSKQWLLLFYRKPLWNLLSLCLRLAATNMPSPCNALPPSPGWSPHPCTLSSHHQCSSSLSCSGGNGASPRRARERAKGKVILFKKERRLPRLHLSSKANEKSEKIHLHYTIPKQLWEVCNVVTINRLTTS